MTGPLTGLKVLDFTALLPGPYATMTLADLGAEVLRITSASRPDPVDFLPPFLPGTELSAGSAYLGRGKRSLMLNIKDPRAVGIIGKLINRYDIIVEQFRPGVMNRLALDYDCLRKIKPDIIYLSLTGYGQTGPYCQRAGHDINYLARSGIMSYSGRKTTGPTLMGIQIADIAAGALFAVIGILAAVVYRQKTGEGQYIDLSMTDGLLAFHALAGCDFLISGQEPAREETALNGGSLYDFYETADGKHISFGGLEPQFFAAFCRAVGRQDLESGGVAPPELPAVKEEIRAIIKRRSRSEWTDIFRTVDACVEPVLSLAEALGDEQTQARQMLLNIEQPGGQSVRQVANPLKFSRSTLTCGKVGTTSSDAREVLSDVGLTLEEIINGEDTGLFR